MLLFKKSYFLFVFMVVILALFSIREAQIFHDAIWLSNTITACEYLLDGHTQLRAFQNRFLPSLIVSGLQNLFSYPHDDGGYWKALRLFLLIVIPVMNVIVQCVLVNKNIAEKLISFFFLNVGIFVFSCRLWYPWDNIELIFFFLFFVSLAKERSSFCYWPLVAIWTVTKETVIFVPFTFFVLMVLQYDSKKIKHYLYEFLNIGVMSVFIVAYTILTRRWFFRGSTLKNIGMDLEHSGVGNFFNLFQNIHDLFGFHQKIITISWCVYLAYALLSLKIVKCSNELGKRFLAMWVVLGVYLIVGFVSALVVEPRMFYPVPAMLIGMYFAQDYFRFSFEVKKPS